jgi:hypothetical protein
MPGGPVGLQLEIVDLAIGAYDGDRVNPGTLREYYSGHFTHTLGVRIELPE